MITKAFKYTVEGSTPSFADNEGQVVERGSQVRLRIKGIRGELGQMFAIGSIKEDYLGSVPDDRFCDACADGFTGH